MSKFAATVKEIKHNVEKTSAAGAVYKATEVHYESKFGVKVKTITNKSLKDNESLLKELKAVSAGDKVEMELAGEPFFDLISIKKVNGGGEKKSSSKPFTKDSKTFVDNSKGMQVGAALHDAVALAVAQGRPDITAVEALAKDLLNVGERLKKGLADGLYTGAEGVKTATVVEKKEEPKTIETDDEEVLWDDDDL